VNCNGEISRTRMTIYLDTMLWNELCDQNVNAAALISALSAQGKVLVLGAEAMYEMAKTFKSNPTRGKQLFAYLKTFTDQGFSVYGTIRGFCSQKPILP